MDKYQVRWKNFRGFEDTKWIRLRPLTLLIGPNNSGKSSLLAPLLLLKQSHASHAPYPPLETKGSFINAGDFEDIVAGHEIRRQIQFGIRFHHHEIKDVSKVRPLGDEPPGELQLTFARYQSSPDAVLKRYGVYDTYGRHLLTRTRSLTGEYSLEGLNHVPRRPKTALKDPKFDRALRKNIRDAQPYHFVFTDIPFTRTLQEKSSNERVVEISEFSQEYLQTVEAVSQQIFNFFFDINYVGPLRERPKRLYELSGSMPDGVGTRGEFAPEILFRQRQTEFIKTVEGWLHRFDFPGQIRSRSISEGAFSLYVGKAKGGLSVNFADTGFGLSQVLPLIVQGFFSEGNRKLMIAEQPEIHLNPKLQSVLGDLFCSIAKGGPAMLIETHSEHLVLRLRRLVAEGQFPAEDISFYYVERQNGRSLIREVPIQANGHILSKDWPQGFFGESLKDSLALATAQSRSRKR